MEFQSRKLLEGLPSGVITCDPRFRVTFMNGYARNRLFRVTDTDHMESLIVKQHFLTPDRMVFDIQGCIREMIASGRRIFQKTLILAHAGEETLVFLTAKSLRVRGKDHYILVMADISDEMDCISTGRFGRGGFSLRQHIIGRQESLGIIFRMIELAADSVVNVVITGESGTGKELVADAIHAMSDRGGGPLVKVNCAALSESLLESELFGHVRGAFTGAVSDKEGKIEQARGGTLFLDEIAEISPAIQVKLLRVIQEKAIERVGGNKVIPVDMRIIAATNQDLTGLVRAGLFREDLYYRLHVFSIDMPPLRERQLDIPLLCDHFIRQFNTRTGKHVKGLSREALLQMMAYPWPGNIRELENAIEHAFVLIQGPVIASDDLPQAIRDFRTGQKPAGKEMSQPREEMASAVQGTQLSGPGRIRRKGRQLPLSKAQLEEALAANGWNQTRTAEYLGISRVALWRKMKKLGI